MKFKILFVILTVSVISQVVLSQQTTKNYLVDEQGNATQIPQLVTKQIALQFKADVPELNDQQISALLRHGKAEVSKEKVKGAYEQFILFYVPRIKADSCFLSGNIVSYQPYQERNENRIFSWWYLFLLLGIMCMIITQIIVNKNKKLCMGAITSVFAGAGAGAFAFAGAVAFAVAGAVAFAGAGAVAVAVAGAVAVAFVVVTSGAVMSAITLISKHEEIFKMFAYIYYISMLIAGIFAYL